MVRLLGGAHHCLYGRSSLRQRLEAVPEYGYQVVSKVRFDRQNFTQGLEIYNGRLYVSSGLYGKSMVRAYDFPSLDLLREVPVDRRIFAEGLTVIDDRLILLSWRERVMLVYDLPDLSLVGQSALPGAGLGRHPLGIGTVVQRWNRSPLLSRHCGCRQTERVACDAKRRAAA
jgi:glutamine cyclotransferase